MHKDTMTIREMKPVACSSPHDGFLTVSSCQWQFLKARGHKHHNDTGDHHGNGLHLPRSRYKHSACCVGEHLYVFCGKEGTSPLKDIWKFHIWKQKWEVVGLRGGSLPFLQGHTAVAYKRLILLFGGTFSDCPGDVQLWTYNTDLSPRSMMRPDPLLTHLSHHPDDYFAKGTAEHLTFLRVMREAHREYPFTGKKDADLIQKAVEVVLHRLPVLRQRATQTQHLFYMNTMTRIAKQRKKKAKQN